MPWAPTTGVTCSAPCSTASSSPTRRRASRPRRRLAGGPGGARRPRPRADAGARPARRRPAVRLLRAPAAGGATGPGPPPHRRQGRVGPGRRGGRHRADRRDHPGHRLGGAPGRGLRGAPPGDGPRRGGRGRAHRGGRGGAGVRADGVVGSRRHGCAGRAHPGLPADVGLPQRPTAPCTSSTATGPSWCRCTSRPASWPGTGCRAGPWSRSTGPRRGRWSATTRRSWSSSGARSCTRSWPALDQHPRRDGRHGRRAPRRRRSVDGRSVPRGLQLGRGPVLDGHLLALSPAPHSPVPRPGSWGRGGSGRLGGDQAPQRTRRRPDGASPALGGGGVAAAPQGGTGRAPVGSRIGGPARDRTRARTRRSARPEARADVVGVVQRGRGLATRGVSTAVTPDRRFLRIRRR